MFTEQSANLAALDEYRRHQSLDAKVSKIEERLTALENERAERHTGRIGFE